jgi:hypothetical protein
MDIEMSSTPDLATLRIDHFAPYLDTVFDMQSPAGVVPLKLTSAVASGAPPPDGLKSRTGEESKLRDGGGSCCSSWRPRAAGCRRQSIRSRIRSSNAAFVSGAERTGGWR